MRNLKTFQAEGETLFHSFHHQIHGKFHHVLTVVTSSSKFNSVPFVKSIDSIVLFDALATNDCQERGSKGFTFDSLDVDELEVISLFFVTDSMPKLLFGSKG